MRDRRRSSRDQHRIGTRYRGTARGTSHRVLGTVSVSSSAVFSCAHSSSITSAASLGSCAGPGDLARPLGNDRRLDEAIEIGTQRRALIRRDARAEPRGDRRLPRAVEIAHRSRRRRQPVAARIRLGSLTQFLLHAIDDALVDLGAPLGRDLRVAVHRGRPPVEHAIAAAGPDVVGTARARRRTAPRRRRNWSSRNSHSPRPTRYSAWLRGASCRGVDGFQRFARRGEMRGVVRLAVALEVGAGDDERRPRRLRAGSDWAATAALMASS